MAEDVTIEPGDIMIIEYGAQTYEIHDDSVTRAAGDLNGARSVATALANDAEATLGYRPKILFRTLIGTEDDAATPVVLEGL